MKTPLIFQICIVVLTAGFTGAGYAQTDRVPTGAEVINNNCSRCHNARPVQEFSLEEWAVIMPHMREKAHLTGAETDAVLRFFQTISRKDTPTSAQATPVPVASGAELITRYGCLGCHSIKGQGGSVGPALDTVISDKGEAFFARKLRNPQFNNPASPMPEMPLSEVEIKALIDYLKEG